jgi:mono/diheme cytochrome c family protein
MKAWPSLAALVALMLPAAMSASAAEGEQLYLQRCAACHDSGQAGIPPRTQLVARTNQFIAEKLLLGSMQAQTLGLSEAQITQIADYLSAPVKATP